jgi:hypothetical protein
MAENFQYEEESDSEKTVSDITVSDTATEFDEMIVRLNIDNLDDIQQVAMGLVKARFEQGPEQNDIYEILCLVWIGWDILIEQDWAQAGDSTENPCWNETNLDDYTLYDLLWIGLFGNFLKRYQGEHPNASMGSLCWGVCEVPTPRSVSGLVYLINFGSNHCLIAFNYLPTNPSNGT